MQRTFLRGSGLAAVSSAAFFSLSPPRRKSHLGAVSAQHSSVPFTEAQTVSCIRGLGQGGKTRADKWTALRVIASSDFAVPLVASGDGAKALMTFPSGKAGAPMVLGAFTPGAYKAVVESNKDQQMEPHAVSVHNLVEFMEDLSSEEKSRPNPAARVGFVSFNAEFLQEWNSETRELWRQLLGAVWVRNTLQKATSPAEIDAALAETLGKGSFWMAETKGPDGKYVPSAVDIGGRDTMLVFCAYDLLLRQGGEEAVRGQQVQGAKLLALMQGGFRHDLAIVHDVLQDGRLGFATISKERADRIAKLR